MSFHNQIQQNTQKLHNSDIAKKSETAEDTLLNDIQHLKIKDAKEFSDKYKQMYDAYMNSHK